MPFEEKEMLYYMGDAPLPREIPYADFSDTETGISCRQATDAFASLSYSFSLLGQGIKKIANMLNGRLPPQGYSSRVEHLARYSKKWRVRKKNAKRRKPYELF